MTGLDAAVLAERSAAVQRHLRRVRERLPDDAAQLRPMSDAIDAVVLHLWQAVQIVIGVAVWACVGLGLGSPPSYGARFGRWASRGAFYDTAIAATAVAQGRAASVSGGVNEALGHTVVRGWPPRRRVEAVVACEAEQGAIQAEELAAQERAGHEVATTVRARSGQGGA